MLMPCVTLLNWPTTKPPMPAISSRATGGSSKVRFLDCSSYERTKRSEEHTSELQSLRHLVCRLLLEKKKTITGISQKRCPYRASALLTTDAGRWADESRGSYGKASAARMCCPLTVPYFFFF